MIIVIPLEIMTDKYNQYFIITEDVKKIVASSKIKNGMVTVETKHNSCEKQKQNALYFLKKYLTKKYESKD